MPCDALTYSHISSELNSTLCGGRIERVGMPSPGEVVLTVRPKGASGRSTAFLLLCCNNTRPRIQLTSEAGENPLSAFSFLMHLRKRIGGGTITKICSEPRERIVKIFIYAFDDLGYRHDFTLFVELMGRYSNLILTGEDGIITDCLKRISFDDFSSRALLPGMKYELPPKPENKFAPEDRESLSSVLDSFDGGELATHLMKYVYGYAPATMKEIVFTAYGTLTPSREDILANKNTLVSAFNELDEASQPCLLFVGGKPVDFLVRPFRTLAGEYKSFATLSEAMDEYYSGIEEYGYLATKAAKPVQAIKSAIKKNQKSLTLLRERLIDSQNYEEDRIFGELITANIYKIRQGMREIAVDNYYTGESVTIKLDERISPQKNAQNYYKSYSKKKTAIAKTEELIATGCERDDYYESILVSLSSAENESDLDEIIAEMESAGLLVKSRGKKKIKRAAPITINVGGFRVSIGKNNTQNDALVRNSNGGWLWLHAQKIHGSHAVIEGDDVPQDIINEVAAYVAHYSKAAMSANVPVDYTLVKYVKKPSGSPPGKVIYTHQQTVNVLPKKP